MFPSVSSKYYGLAIVDGHVRPGLGGDDGGCPPHLTVNVGVPLTKSSHHDWLTIGPAELVGLLLSVTESVPLVEHINRDEDSLLLEC